MLFIISCSVKKDKFINRNVHAVTTEYNVLYNGNLALDAGLENLKTTFKDNFWEILPVERMQEKEENFVIKTNEIYEGVEIFKAAANQLINFS